MSHERRKPDAPPSTTVDDGRRPDGRFGPDNKFARGGAPLAARGLALRTAMLAAVSPRDIALIISKLIERAKRGDVKAAREILNRTCGKPIAADQREPLQILIASEGVLADRVDAIRSLRLRQATGEQLDLNPSDDPLGKKLDLVGVDPPAERRRLLREVEVEGGAQ